MKNLKVGNIELLVSQHKGDITYERFVIFKQYAPQFWEKMDSPLFAVYWEAFENFMNEGKYMQAYGKMSDYKMAIEQSKNSYDAWGICFVLISGKDEADLKKSPNDADIEKRLNELKKEGLTAEVVNREVLNFMQASPETFTDHLTLYALQSSTSEMID